MSYKNQNENFARQIEVAATVFSKPSVVVELPPSAAGAAHAGSAFLMTANLLCRIFQNLFLSAPSIKVDGNPWGIQNTNEIDEILALISEGSVSRDLPPKPDIVVGVGAEPTIRGKRETWFSFSGWECGLEKLVPQIKSMIPFGALMGACYGAAQTFLHGAQLFGSSRRTISSFRSSLLDYSAAGTNGDIAKNLDLGESHLVGVGAIGSAVIYSLAHLPGISGTLHAIDDDPVGETNLHRYILMRRSDIEKNKCDVAVNGLSHTGLRVEPHRVRFEEFIKNRRPNIDLLLTPVDSEAARRKLATHLPRAVLNAATGNSTVTVSSHGFGNGKACLHCLYLLVPGTKSAEEVMAHDLGLTPAEVENMMAANLRLSSKEVARVEQHRQVPPGTFREWAGSHVQSFYQRAVCGSAPVQFASGTIVAPLSFISALAGVMLSAELVKARVPSLRHFALDNYFRLDCLFAPNADFRQRVPANVGGRCICQDRDYVKVYNARYGR